MPWMNKLTLISENQRDQRQKVFKNILTLISQIHADGRNKKTLDQRKSAQSASKNLFLSISPEPVAMNKILPAGAA